MGARFRMRDAPTDRPFVIPIFIPHAGCPHRCVFCNQTRTTSNAHTEGLPTIHQIDKTIVRYLSYRKDPHRYTEISYYGGNFLGLTIDEIRFLLESVSRYISQGRIQGIRFSTRPDTITRQKLDLLAAYPISTVELGVQSMNNQVLQTSRRGHTAEDTHQAVALLKQRAYRLGLQMMVGLPGDTTARAMTTGEQMAALKPDFVRIYPTLVLKASRLADWHDQGRYRPMALDAAVELVKKLYQQFISRNIRVIRMGLQATEGLDSGTDMVAGPFHPAFGELVHSAMWLDAMRAELKTTISKSRNLTIEMHPRLMSRVRGHGNRNIKNISTAFDLEQINILTDAELPRNMIRLNGVVVRGRGMAR